ncbi:MAG: DUF6765 family protein [Smithella sp.]
MQIDFHHAVTYVAARLAGFPHEEADIIAYAAQYVDDATSQGIICFDNKALYERNSSAHKSIDPKNLDALDNQKVWMPFHFLPGNGSPDPGESSEGKFIHKLICFPDSPVAKDMIKAAILDQDKDRNNKYALHRLGITMHVYADTWAHQGFAGVKHDVNKVVKISESGHSNVFKDVLINLINKSIPELGHGQAYVFPDMPFLSWEYVNGHKKTIPRNNTDEFCKAADALCKAMKRYRLKSPDAEVTGIGENDMNQIRKLFTELKTEDGEDRHQEWINKIEQGIFSFGPATISYAEDGKGSWKAEALGTSKDTFEYTYKESFLTSNWKLFHDALQLHRITVSHDILPKYGICAA